MRYGQAGEGTTAAPGFALVLQASGAERLTVALGDFLLKADYVRAGPDLVLEGTDGTKVLLVDYFSGEHPPDLWTAEGSLVRGDLAARLAGPMAPAQFAQAAPAGQGQPIGTVERVEGQAAVERAGGASGPLAQGDPVYQNDVVTTGAGSAVGIRFVDDTAFAMQANGRMVLDNLIYNAAGGTGSASFSILQGAFVFVTGQIGHNQPDNVQVQTPLATIGIRGTIYGGVQGQVLDAYYDYGDGVVANLVSLREVLSGQKVRVTSTTDPIGEPQNMSPGEFDSIFAGALEVIPQTPFFLQERLIDYDGPSEQEQEQQDGGTGREGRGETEGTLFAGKDGHGTGFSIGDAQGFDDIESELDDSAALFNYAVGGGGEGLAGEATTLPSGVVDSRDEVLPVSGGLDLVGTVGADNLTGGSGNDTIFGDLGNDLLIGGGGTDTAVYVGNSASYAFRGGSTIVNGPEGEDTLEGIEFLQFSDVTVPTPEFGGPSVAGNIFQVENAASVDVGSTVDHILFTVNASGVVGIDIKSWEVDSADKFDGDGDVNELIDRNADGEFAFFDSQIYVFTDAGGGAPGTLVASNNNSSGTFNDGSLATFDSFLTANLAKGKHILAIGATGLTEAEARSQLNDNTLYPATGDGLGNLVELDHGDYQVQFVGAVSVTGRNAGALANEIPVAVDDVLTTIESTAAQVNVLANDTAGDGALTVLAVGTASNGTVTIVNASAGTVQYTPTAGFIGNDSFTYTLEDGNGDQRSADVDVTVNPAAIPIVWTGAVGDNLWGSAGNWDLARVPIAGDGVTLPAGLGVTLFNTGATTVETLTSTSDNFQLAGGTLTVDTKLLINAPSTFSMTGGTLNGAGLADVASGATFFWQNGILDGTSDFLVNGTLLLSPFGSTLTLNTRLLHVTTGATGTATNGTLQGTGEFCNEGMFTAQAFTFNLSLFDNKPGGSGVGQMDVKATVNVSGTFQNSAGATLNVIGDGGQATLVANDGLTNDGTLNLLDAGAGSGAVVQAVNAPLTNTGTITTQVAGGGARTLDGDIDNSGTIDIETTTTVTLAAAQAFDNMGNLGVEAGQTLLVNGGTFNNLSGGSIFGNGTLNLSATTIGTNQGSISPGSSAGTLTWTGDFVQASTGSLEIEIGGTTAGQFDVFNIGGNATLDGALNITLINGYTAVLGDSFDVITATSLTGTFASFTGLSVGTGLELDPTIAGGTLTLTVVASTVNGTAGDDLLNGTALADVINGLGGNDTITGLGSTDTLDGGTGNDSIDAGTGNDSLIGGAGNDTLLGNAGNDTLEGNAGDDLLFGGAGTDSIVGGADFDIADFSDLALGITVDMAAGTANTADGLDTLSGIEAVRGSSGADVYLGGSGPGADPEYDDTFEGMAGNDTITGGGDTIVVFVSSTQPVTVDLSLLAPTATGTDIGVDNLTGITNIVGSPQNDVIIGGGADESFAGGDGVDNLDGGGGTNELSFNIGTDVPNGVVVDLLAGTVTDDGYGNADIIANFSDIEGSIHDDVISGGLGANFIDGEAGDDTLMGNDGMDVLYGAEGADSMDGGIDDDVYFYNIEADGAAVATDQTVAASGVATDTVDNFVSGGDSFNFDSGGFDAAAVFVSLGSPYDGTNSGVGAGAAFIFDGTHLIYDADVTAAGYTVVAEVNGNPVIGTDITVT